MARPPTSDPDLDVATPPWGLVTFVALALVVTPLVLPAGVGAFRMFTGVVSYRLDLAVTDASVVPRRVPVRSLAGHLGADARRVIGPADRWVVGETNAALLAGGLDEVAALVCAMYPGAREVRTVLWRRTLREEPLPRLDRVVSCDRP